jgi:hypothetical protein
MTTTEQLKASITQELFLKMVIAMDEFLSREENRDFDTVEEFLKAAKHAESLGLKIGTYNLEVWMDEQLSK